MSCSMMQVRLTSCATYELYDCAALQLPAFCSDIRFVPPVCWYMLYTCWVLLIATCLFTPFPSSLQVMHTISTRSHVNQRGIHLNGLRNWTRRVGISKDCFLSSFWLSSCKLFICFCAHYLVYHHSLCGWSHENQLLSETHFYF